MKKKIILILSMVALLVVILAFSVSATSVTYISEGFVGNTVNQNVYADLSYVNYGNDSNKNFNIICVQLSDTGSYIFIVDNVEAFQYRFSGYSFVDVVSEIYGTTDEDFDYYRNGFSNLASCTDAIEYFLNWSAPYSAEDFFNELDSLRNSFDGELSRDAFNTYVENNAGAQFISLYFGKLNVFLNTFYFSGFEDFSKLLDTVYTEFKSSSPDDLSGQAFNEYVSSLLSDEFHYFAFYYTNGANTFADNMYNAGVTLSSGLDISDGSFDISDSELTDTDYDNLNVPSCLVCNSSGTCEHFAAGYKNGYHDALFSDKNKENLQNAFDQGKEYACTNGVYQNFVNAAMETSIISFKQSTEYLNEMQSAFDSGMDAGYNNGKIDGISSGYDDGYSAGMLEILNSDSYQNSYKNGFNDGVDSVDKTNPVALLIVLIALLTFLFLSLLIFKKIKKRKNKKR